MPLLRGGRLEGRGCLVVGGTSGIGLASARRFLEEGARVVVTGHSAESTREALEQLAPLGPAHGVTADVTAPGGVEALFQEAMATLGGRLDVLFHVAGISGRRLGDGPLHECTEEGWDAVMNANARGLFLTNQAAVRRMLAQEIDEAGLRGTVLNMGSVLGWSPSPELFGTYAYAASKGAVRAMTMAAAARYASERVRFNLIAPGLIDTPMAARAVGNPTIRAYLAAKQPLAGGPGTPEDCAEAALYLCEPASRFVTGAVLTVDGGWCVSEGWHRSPQIP
jgi:NAD(P)-dependent dehydrogenase (short-subunit alcohol dehydrogenase family)